MQENPTPLMVVAAALIADGGKVCLQQRAHGKQHGGLWEFPGGKIETGESAESALVREIEEELGIVLDPHLLVPAGFASDPGNRADGRPALVILLYCCRRWTGRIRCLEGEAVGWFEPRDLISAEVAPPMPPLDYPLARGLWQLLCGGMI